MTRPRRDPRAELAGLRVPSGARLRLDRTPRPAPTRPRRNPRAEQTAQIVASASRLRLDRAQRTLAVPAADLPSPRAVKDIAPRIITIDDPAYLVAVVPDAPGGRLTPHDLQLIGAGRLLARDAGAVLVVSTVPIEGLGAAGADRCVTLPSRIMADDPGALAGTLVDVLQGIAARHVLFPETPRGGDLARRVAVALREPLFTRCEAVTANNASRAAGGRRVEQRATPPRFIALLPDAVAIYAGDPHEARPLGDAGGSSDRARPSAIVSVEHLPADPASVPLGLADFVVAAGHGIKDFDAFRQLVAALNATPGASRMLCDAGLMPRQSQVGASGTVLSATCYFALGIAGAPQHLQGVADCQHVVAVNTDLHAAMIARAELAIVQDAQLVMPALLDALAKEYAS